MSRVDLARKVPDLPDGLVSPSAGSGAWPTDAIGDSQFSQARLLSCGELARSGRAEMT